MHASTALVLAATALLSLLSLTITSPISHRLYKRTTTSPFILIGARSASPVHLQSITANGGLFWIGKPSNSECPSGLEYPCTKIPATVLEVNNDYGLLFVEVPGGQDVYVSKQGALSFTEPHQEGSEEPIEVEGGAFHYENSTDPGALGSFSFSINGTATGFLACPTANNGSFEYQGKFPVPPYQIYAAIPDLCDKDVLGGNVTACIGFDALGSEYDTTKNGIAFQYN